MKLGGKVNIALYAEAVLKGQPFQNVCVVVLSRYMCFVCVKSLMGCE